LDINDSNWIVGRSWHTGSNPNITSAFIWRNGAMTDLSSLILTKSGITIARASAINNAGQIAAQGEPGHVGVLLTPAPGPPGDLNADCVVGIVDLLALLGSWGPCPGGASCTADLDDDGTVGVTDFLTLLANWS
jgi:probable HAF family extracellular repeat protein